MAPVLPPVNPHAPRVQRSTQRLQDSVVANSTGAPRGVGVGDGHAKSVGSDPRTTPFQPNKTTGNAPGQQTSGIHKPLHPGATNGSRHIAPATKANNGTVRESYNLQNLSVMAGMLIGEMEAAAQAYGNASNASPERPNHTATETADQATRPSRPGSKLNITV